MTSKRKQLSTGETKSTAPKFSPVDDTKEMTLLELPDKILYTILKYIPKSQWASLESVCKKFRRIILDFWQDLPEINIEEELFTSRHQMNCTEIVISIMEKLLLRSPNLKAITGFHKCHDHSTAGQKEILRIYEKFQNLQAVQLDGSTVLVADIIRLLNSSASRAHLQQVNVLKALKTLPPKRPFYGMSIRRGVSYIRDHNLFGSRSQRHLLSLKELRFSIDSDRPEVPFVEFLRQIDFSSLTTLAFPGMRLCPGILTTLLGHCPQIEHLQISIDHCHHTGQHDQGNLKRQLLAAIENLVNLSFLKLDYSAYNPDLVQDGTFQNLISRMGNQRRLLGLSILDRNMCTPAVVAVVVEKMPYLKSFELHELFSDRSSLLNVASNMRQLEKLSVGLCKEGCGEFISTVATNLDQLKSLRIFSQLDMQHGDGSAKNIKQLKNLKELRMQGLVDDSVLKSWSEEDCELKLGVLELCPYKEITDAGFISLLGKMSEIRRLELLHATITDNTLQAIAQQCFSLTDLYLDECRAVTAGGAQEIIDHCVLLKRLRMRGTGEWFPGEIKLQKYRHVIFTK